MYRYLRIIILLAVLTAPMEVRGSALSFPPSALRMVIFNSIDGSNLTATPVTVQLNTLAPSVSSQTRSMLVGNDAAADATGNSDLIVDVSGTTAAVPANGVSGSSAVRIFPGKEYNFDGQYTFLSMRSRSTSIPVHVFVSY